MGTDGDKLAMEEDVKVKITPNNDTKIDMEKEKEKEVEAEGFKGLTKDELMQYANDPFWVRLRWVLFIAFWVIWIAMLVASIAIIVYTPKCPSPEPKQWWQKGPVYKASVQDFPDTNNDGKGDLVGMKEKADYLVKAWVGTVYFSSLLNKHNLETVAQDHGSMEDWKAMVSALQDRNIRIMVEMDPTSTSEQHLWYEEFKSGTPDYANFYEASGSTKLNLNNEAVVTKIEDVSKFWLQNGVDGLVLKETVPRKLLDKLRGVMDQELEATGIEKVLVFEGANAEGAEGNFTGVGAGNPVHLVAGEDIFGDEQTLSAPLLKTTIDDFIAGLPCKPKEEGDYYDYCLWPAFTFSTTRHDQDMMDALTMLKMLLPGTVLTQGGEELGLLKVDVSLADDPGVKKHLDLYRLLAEGVRGQDAILYGELNVNNTLTMANDTVFALTRVKKGSPGYLLVINFANENVTVDFSKVPNIPESVRVLERYNVMAVSPRGEEESTKFPSNEISLVPRQAKIFNFVPKFK